MNTTIAAFAITIFLFVGFTGAGAAEKAAVDRQPAAIEVIVSIITPDPVTRDFVRSLKSGLAKYLAKPVGREISGRWLVVVTESVTGERPTLNLSAFGDREGGGMIRVETLTPAKLANPAVAGKFAALRSIRVIRNEVRWRKGREIHWQVSGRRP